MALQHLRSGTANKRPIPTAMSDGQLAVNTNLASPGLFFKDSNGDLVKAGPVHVGTTAPNASPASTAATALVANTIYQILTVGTSDFTAVGASANTVGTVFTATGTTTGTGTVSGQQGNEKGEQWLDTTNSLYVMKVYDGTGWRVTDSISLANGSAAAPSLHFGSDTNTGLFRSAADSLAITTAGTQRVVVDSSGRVGIGNTVMSSFTANSSDNLVVGDGSGSEGITVYSAAQGSVSFADGTSGNAAYRGAIEYNHTVDQLAFRTAGTGNRMVIDSSGRLLLGTTTEGEGNADDLTVATSGHTGMTIRSGTANRGNIYFSDGTSGDAEYRGYIEYNHDGDKLSFGTANSTRLHINSSGNCGIGTTSPSQILELKSVEPRICLNGTTENNEKGIEFEHNGTRRGHIFHNASTGELSVSAGDNSTGHFITFNTNNGSESARITSDGKIGVGTSSPSESLEVAGNGFKVSGQTSGVTDEGLTFDWDSGSNNGRIFSESAGSSNLLFYTTASGSRGERMRLNSSGYLGLGTSSPQRMLHIAGGAQTGLKISGNNTGSTSSDGFDIYVRDDNNGVELNQREASHIALLTSGSEKMRLDSSGNVIIGTTSAATASQLTVRAASPNLSLYATPGNASIINLGDTDAYNIGRIKYDNSNNSLQFDANNAERLRITSDGKIGVGVTSPSTVLHLKDSADTYLTLQAGTTDGNDGVLFKNSGGTQKGALVYDTDDNYLLFNVNSAERMRLDSSGRLGIGTASPDYGLHLHSSSSYFKISNSGTGEGGSDGMLIGIDGTGNSDFWNYENKFIRFATNNSERLRITSDGKLGVGTTNPGGNLTVTDASTYTLDVKANGGAGALLTTLGGSASLALGTNNTERMRIDSSGKVGININNPGSYNSAGNELVLGNTGNNGGLTIVSGTGNNGHIFFADGTSGGALNRGIIKYEHGSDSMAFNTAESERMRIDSSGIVLIGKSAVSTTTSGATFGYGNGENHFVNNTSDSGSRVVLINRQGSNGISVDFRKADSVVGTITVDSSSTSYNTSSDYRLKENVVNIADGITRVKQLAPRRFNFIEDSDKTVDGFLAHEAQIVVPEAVTGEKDGEEMQGIDQSKLVPLLTAALQEAIAKIETLEQRLSDAGIA